jgi:small-conductance mechanosensitive channel
VETNERDSKTLEILMIATSFFRFYYYTIRRSKKKYDIVANPKESVMAMMTPMILILIYLFISGVFLSEALAMSTTFLFIPVFIFNFMYLSHVSNEGYRIRREKIDREHEKRMEEIKRAREKKEWDDYVDRLIREQVEEEMRKRMNEKRASQKASIDQNKLNAIKLMGLSNNPTIEEVKKSYRKLSKIHHPDVGGTQTNFIRLTKAYDYLIESL